VGDDILWAVVNGPKAGTGGDCSGSAVRPCSRLKACYLAS
jgi:hypothetical protein